jgi:uncharacterized protein YcaQ
MQRVRLSTGEARRVALAAQGFDRDRKAGKTDIRHFRRVIESLGLLQLDFVNVLIPAHFLILWSRLGSYDRHRCERYIYDSGELTEQWAHEASIVPSSAWPLLAYRRKAHKIGLHNPIRKLRGRTSYLDAVLEQVRRDGAVTANDLPPVPGPRRKPGDWHRSIPRCALEYHFATGALAVANRLTNFQRVYDLPERVLPEEHLSRDISEEDARRELIARAAGSMGVATLKDLADYYRMSAKDVAPLVQDLVNDGALSAVSVEGWQETGYLSSTARLPRRIAGASLLSPFDPVVWYRPRAERLFDFHYRIEIYVPAAQRKWGYYVLPFRIGDVIVARVDLKADRQSGNLLVLAAHQEPGTDRSDCVSHLARELRSLADWLELDDICVTKMNEFSRNLAASTSRRTCD